MKLDLSMMASSFPLKLRKMTFQKGHAGGRQHVCFEKDHSALPLMTWEGNTCSLGWGCAMEIPGDWEG